MDSNTKRKNDEDTNWFIRPLWPWLTTEVSTSEITSIDIHCDQTDDKYFFGEDATLFASFGNPSAVCSLKWVKKTDSGDHTIDITLQKYTGSTCCNEVESPMLIIKNCDESDIGTYFLSVSCRPGISIYSNKIDLKVVEGCPEVTLDLVPLALQNECVEFKATIRGFPECHDVSWMKDNQPIYITDPKYEGSITDKECPVLCIKKVNMEDSGVYKIIVHNKLGKGERSEDLEVIGAYQMIFISGPVVVSPSETIAFHAYLPGQETSNAKWWKIKDKSKKVLKADDKKYCICQMKDKIRFEITLADKEDSAAYQLVWNTKKSNRIYVHVDDSGKFSTSKQGNCLRLFELQSVSADAMRLVFNNLGYTFEKIMQYCESPPKSRRKNDLLSRLKDNTIDPSKDVDISVMYSIIKDSMKKEGDKKPQNGWGNFPKEDHDKTLDDIERIRYYRNLISHSDASGMDTNTFNLSCLDLFKAIERLSHYDPKLSTKLIKTSCEIMNRVSTKGKELQKMIEEFKNQDKDKMLDQPPLNKELSSSPLSSSREDMDEGPRPSLTNKDPSSSPLSSSREDMDEGPRPSLTNKDPSSSPLSSSREDMDEGPIPSLTNKDPSSSPLSSSRENREESPMSKTSPSSTYKESLHDTRITTRSSRIENMRFHEVCDPDIIMNDNLTRATQSRLHGNGVCFMNRPLKLKEKVHIYGSSYSNSPFREIRPKIKIGLTNTDPEKIREMVLQKKYTRRLVEINCFSDDDRTTDSFHICICLCLKAILSISVNGSQPYIYKYQEISSLFSIWLVIEPYGIRSISISNN